MLFRLVLILALALQPTLGIWSSDACCEDQAGACCPIAAAPADRSCSDSCSSDNDSGPCCQPATCDPSSDLACNLCNALCRTLCSQGGPTPLFPGQRTLAPKPPRPLPAPVFNLTDFSWPRPERSLLA